MAAMSSSASFIVAIETSTELASVAVLGGGRLCVRESNGAQTHSASVLPMLQSALAEAGIRLADADTLAFGCGPGAFTGVRTACGLVQGLATGAGRPVIPVVSLLAMAEAARAAGAGDEVLAVLDARMGEVYWAHYRFDGQWQQVAPPALAKAADLALPGAAALCGNGLSAYPEAFAAHAAAVCFPDILPHAASVARLAVAALNRGEAVAPRHAQPLYLRDKVALTTRERAAVSTAAGAAA